MTEIKLTVRYDPYYVYRNMRWIAETEDWWDRSSIAPQRGYGSSSKRAIKDWHKEYRKHRADRPASFQATVVLTDKGYTVKEEK